ncbi:MAG: chorismate synthase [Acidobacterium sp.]|nr:MAG: chorismate synthase [Acidobacterium sp.]
MLRFLTAGESHGQGLVTILEGLPAGLTIDIDAMTVDLRRRQGGYGRGRRMAIESDRAEILSGVRRGRTTGAPVALLVRNKDWENWQNTMHVEPQAPAGATGANRAAVVRPRPGHADLAGALKYDHDDIRDVLERASARETAARVAAGAIARQLLAAIGCELTSHITGIGPVVIPAGTQVSFEAAQSLPLEAPLRCTDPMLEQQMMASIDAAKEAGDTLGGSFEVIVRNVPVGLGSYVHWDRKLDGRLAQALMSIPAIKAVAVGDGVDGARRPGSLVHDEIVADAAAAAAGEPVLRRPTNRAGGLEGGVTNGEEVRMTGFMKPIATLMKPLRSIDLTSMEDAPAAIERSDVCAVPAAAVVAEAMVALVLADAVLERFGGDSMTDLLARVTGTGNKIRARLSIRPTSARA